jgi:uncharacterized membrane protein YhaH (DUF805 family)
MSEVPGSFAPLRRASRSGRVTVYLIGPLLWVVALVVVSLLVIGRNAVELGLLVAATAFVVAIVVLVPQRMLRVRREKEHASPR